jgi:hypothetical protein
MAEQLPVVAKQLKSYEPDLDVVVGSDQQVFRCHGLILASYSAYIDTMLSTPMKEQSTMDYLSRYRTRRVDQTHQVLGARRKQ